MPQEQKNFFGKIILSFFLFFLILTPWLAQADDNTAGQTCVTGSCQGCNNFAQEMNCRRETFFGFSGYKLGTQTGTVAGRVGVIVDVVMMISGVIFFALIVYSGIQWMASAGNEESVKKAKTRISRAVIGLALIVGAWLIVNFVLSRVLGGIPASESNQGSVGGSGAGSIQWQTYP